ncbi:MULTISPECIES: flagellar basal body rod protein FlgB [Bacillaceae]|uniref:Flagellar basal body rod protein FlgB n=1 Tax=Evansella alkalicola TaxID=745819 RepID=A0ABS6JP29_9BACI|nr:MULTISPECIES: flagellar basal body rod protein FlgB [Bacillaceae]MBU9720313.1 flagellar basal body rod protein FlgB [Bacillus alkalicola]
MNLINNSTNALLQTAMSSAMTRQKTIANNIANADTPNYKAKKTVFAHELERASDAHRLQSFRTDSRHFEFGGSDNIPSARVVERSNTQMNHNGNNVDIDIEMADLAQNQIYYNTLIDRMNGRFNSIRTVLGQGR